MFDWLKDFVSGFFGHLFDGLLWLVNALVEVIGYGLYLIYDGILLVLYSFASAIDMSSIAFNYAASYSALPPQLIYIINQLCFPQFMTYVVGALIIRMMLNLIPAAVTRV